MSDSRRNVWRKEHGAAIIKALGATIHEELKLREAASSAMVSDVRQKTFRSSCTWLERLRGDGNIGNGGLALWLMPSVRLAKHYTQRNLAGVEIPEGTIYFRSAATKNKSEHVHVVT